MKVSVIIPLYNRKDLVGYTLDSLIATKHPHVELEVIVVDDGSTDGSFEFVAENYPWVQLHRNPQKGAPSARNYGLCKASYDFIHFLDSDDLVEPDFFRTKVSFLKSNPDYGSVIGQWEHFDSVGIYDVRSVIKQHCPYPIETHYDKKLHLKRLLGGWYIPINAFVHRKDRIINIGGFDETLSINQDVDLTFKVLLKSSFISIEGPKVLIRQHNNERVGQAITRDKIKQMILLRKSFMAILKHSNLWDYDMANELSTFCFNRWKELYRTHEDLAQEYLSLSKECNPKLRVKGGILYRSMACIFGNENAYLIKEKLQNFL